MGLRSDSSLWFNLPGIVAAWQPVRAPGPTLARYNMANGGDNRYKATQVGTVNWNGYAGWIFSANINNYFTTDVIAMSGWSLFCRFSNSTSSADVLCGSYDGAALRFYVAGLWNNAKNLYGNGGLVQAGANTEGVIAVAGQQGYANGLPVGSEISAWSGTNTRKFYIGCYNESGTAKYPVNGNIQCIVIYERVLSPAEVWQASRQMAYCNVNPDWSAWGRRREWFYLAPTASSSYDDAASLGRTDAISQLANLVIDVEISGYGVFAESVGLSRLAGVSESGLLELAGLLSLGRTAGVDLAGLLELSGSLSLGRLAGLDASSLAVLGETISLGREAGISASGLLSIQTALDLSRLLGIATSFGAMTYNESLSLGRVNGVTLLGWLTMGMNISLGKSLAADFIGGMALEGALILSNSRGIDLAVDKKLYETVNLARNVGISETALQILVGAISLGRQAGISVLGLVEMAAAVMLGYQVGITETSIGNLFSDVDLSRIMGISDVLTVITAVITAITRIYRVPAEARGYAPVYDRSYLVPIDRRVLEAV